MKKNPWKMATWRASPTSATDIETGTERGSPSVKTFRDKKTSL